MNKSELVDAVRAAQRFDIPRKHCEEVVSSVFKTITEVLGVGGEVGITGFGSFKVKEAAARTGRNPQTGDTINIPAKKKPAFKPGKDLKSAVA